MTVTLDEKGAEIAADASVISALSDDARDDRRDPRASSEPAAAKVFMCVDAESIAKRAARRIAGALSMPPGALAEEFLAGIIRQEIENG